ncbi:MAG TPA: methionine--tRNA ligase [Methanothermococcus okinawensis]|uniref:Methionine--tRNA ligase n=1 Tax=Methanofervidicoccus abyssi TaxID=2082189 RepID=A0A401HRN3_9EURY|nr:methionine--tRNA ligase [Methanofervidicoccus abyssi]GBF36852.1 methionyl-tRNA synthetase [Methanofervidicoccus abyssi]HIP15755.1 methionine--tRNA ligase [Methanothermococcus okinawensis]
MGERYLITTALAYTNGPLHLGHVRSTYIPADVMRRYLKMIGKDVVHIGGTDNHGVPITITAEKEGVSPEEIVNKYHEEIKRDLDSLSIEFDSYGKTHSEIHIKTAQEFYLKLKENSYIYEKEIEQFYCPHCKKFLADRYVEGTCPYCGGEARGDHCEICGRHLEPTKLIDPYCVICKGTPEIRKTKHRFFKLSALAKELKEYIKNSKIPDYVKNMAYRWIEELHDWDISRDISWGVPLPDDNSQVMYVWLEAPIGYISFTKMLGDVWKDYWLKDRGKDVDVNIWHFIGKDIAIHHSVFWPGMLIAHGEYNLPTSVISGGYLTLEKKKMSTSKRWVVWVKDFIKYFHPDYLRYFLMINAPLNKDCDFSFEDFQKRINTELIAIIGNFIHRTLVFIYRKFKKIIKVDRGRLKEEDLKLLERCEEIKEKYHGHMMEFNFKEALMDIIHLAQEGNNYFQKMEPWNVKEEERLKEILYTCGVTVKYIIYLLYPFMPNKCMELLDIMNEELDLDIRGGELKKVKVVFKKIENKEVELAKKEILNIKDKKEENMITIEDFAKLDLRIGQILEAEEIPRSKKLLKLIVDIGDEKRQIVAGIKGHYAPEELVGKKVVVLCNLKPAKLCGVESQGMILAGGEETVALLVPDRDIPVGSMIK